MNPKEIGLIGEAKALAKLIELGYMVYLPFGENSKSDFIVEIDETLLILQVKTTEKLNQNKTFSCRLESTRSNKTENKRIIYSSLFRNRFYRYCIY